MGIGKKSKNNIAAIRETVYNRDGQECIVQNSTFAMLHNCAGIMTLQHAVKRGMGSSARWDGAPYLRVMCAFHNQLAESDAAFAQACIRNGWSIPRWVAETNPANRIPVLYPAGWFLLDGNSKFEIPEAVAIDLKLEIYGE